MAAAAVKYRPRVLVTNDDGIDAPGLRALVHVLIATDLYDILVCAPYSDMSGSSHSMVFPKPIGVSEVKIEGTIAYAVKGTPADCASLGISSTLFNGPPDLVISGINKGSNCGSLIMYSGTVAGAREAFLQGVPSISLSYEWVRGKSSVDDFQIGAQACIPIINALLTEISNGTYHQGSFLNIDLPTDILHHKGYKVTKQGNKSIIELGWKMVNPTAQDGKNSSTADVKVDSLTVDAMSEASNIPKEIFFAREVRARHVSNEEGTDQAAVQEGYITVTPLAAVFNAEVEACDYYKDWMLRAVPCEE